MVFPSLCSLIFDIVLSRNKEVVHKASGGIYDLRMMIYDRRVNGE